MGGTDFDKMIDIPAVNNDTSKEETKGGEKQPIIRKHKYGREEVSQMLLAVRAPYGSLI